MVGRAKREGHCPGCGRNLADELRDLDQPLRPGSPAGIVVRLADSVLEEPFIIRILGTLHPVLHLAHGDVQLLRVHRPDIDPQLVDQLAPTRWVRTCLLHFPVYYIFRLDKGVC